MKLPDITIFFQIIHFLFAYWALRRFIFAPALEIIQSQEQRAKSLGDKIERARTDFKKNVEQQHHRWSFIRQSLLKMSPSVNVKKTLFKTKVATSQESSNLSNFESEKKSIQKMLHDKLLDIS